MIGHALECLAADPHQLRIGQLRLPPRRHTFHCAAQLGVGRGKCRPIAEHAQALAVEAVHLCDTLHPAQRPLLALPAHLPVARDAHEITPHVRPAIRQNHATALAQHFVGRATIHTENPAGRFLLRSDFSPKSCRSLWCSCASNPSILALSACSRSTARLCIACQYRARPRARSASAFKLEHRVQPLTASATHSPAGITCAPPTASPQPASASTKLRMPQFVTCGQRVHRMFTSDQHKRAESLRIISNLPLTFCLSGPF